MPPGITYETAGSVGTLIGAAMESAGHMAQSQLLDQLNGPFGEGLGGLLFLIGVVGAVITVAVGGVYKHARWLLVGPAMFYFLINTRVNSDGAEWRFGDRVHDMGAVFRADNGILNAGSGRAGRVSRAFLVWDRLTSDVVQTLISILKLTQDGSDLDFLAKTDRYLQIYAAQSDDPFLTFFLNIALNNQCSRYYSLQRIIHDPSELPDRISNARNVLEAMGEHTVVFNLYERPDLENWVLNVLGDQAELYFGPLTCRDLWELGIELVKKVMAEQFIDHLTRYNLPDGLAPASARTRLLRRFGMHVANGRVVRDASATDEQRMIYLLNELTARIMIRELAQRRPQLAAMSMDEHPQLAFGEAGRQMDQGTARGIRSIGYADEYQYKGELIAGALAMPHIQGMILYYLAMSFPVFALVSILPGRQRAVLGWMGLWLWAKLWDFGLAVVMMVDNLLYALLPHGTPLQTEALREPGRAMNTVFEVDPTFSAHTYYNLLACCMFAIPAVTGFLVHKGSNEIMSALGEGFKEFPTSFGNSLAAYQRAMMAQRNLGDVHKQTYDTVNNHLWDAVKNDKDVRDAVATQFEMAFGKGAIGDLKHQLSSSTAFNSMSKPLGGAEVVAGRAITMLRQQGKNVAAAKLKANLSMAAYHASHSDFAVDRAAEAVGAFHWNSHDAGYEVPLASLIGVKQATQSAPLGQVRDEVVNQSLKQIGIHPGGKK